MAKAKTSKKPKKFSTKGLTKHKPNYELLSNPKILKEVLVGALMENDIETFKECLIAHLKASSKVELAKKTKLGRQTLYDMINGKRKFNPSLETLGAILETIAA